ncbi:Gfo/Idh/MocA family oxidoreductase [Agreia sp. PsM10]|uniref:Gfo/Idh/MocA family oxidoreductase n=1 Tax=Agreia sp. PsM10 TaxID=3030533 RepID=UPI00263B3FE5|nr:Gfo/Idh/MocA family oxidoreductase [Agreia sp. PsM10]MDN4640082.1 Gfo/Idh/MocA family oxidoreductase [Agreia sp. PsM10]
MSRERYGMVGTGHRAEMYIDALIGPHSDVAELVAWSDSNPGRLDYYADKVRAAGFADPVRFDPAALADTVRAQRLDRIIVTTPDFTHAEFVSAALIAGADVVVEKPLTIDREGLDTIRVAVEQSGRSVVTTFNYRYSPRNSALRTLIAEGSIGQVTSVHFEWALDTMHGADYFRRWHRDKANSGGLLVHKSSHHFDLVNWWIDSSPVRVFASGGLRFYGEDNAQLRRGGLDTAAGGLLDQRGAADPFALDIAADPRLKALYVDTVAHDGYHRDQNVFGPGITIEDNLAVLVDYASGATMSYSLNAHSPWEGYRVTVNGTEGRAELEVVERSSVLLDADGRAVLDPSANPVAGPADTVRPMTERLVLQRHWESAREVPIPEGVGGHGGGDAFLLEHLFTRVESDAPLGRVAGFDDGVRAVSVGIAGNESLRTGLPVILPFAPHR